MGNAFNCCHAFVTDGSAADFYAAAAAYHQHGPPAGGVDPSMYYNQQAGVVMGEAVGAGFGPLGPTNGGGVLPGQPTGSEFDHVALHYSHSQPVSMSAMVQMAGQDSDMMFASS